MSFFYCIATLLEFAGVHYFTKVGSGEINALIDDEWEDVGETIEHAGTVHVNNDMISSQNQLLGSQSSSARKRNSIICPIYNVNITEMLAQISSKYFDNFQNISLSNLFGTGSINNVCTKFNTFNNGTNYTNRTTESQEMEANLVMLFG